MRVFFAFPGQGTQRPGILHGLNTFGLSVLEEMSNAIGLDLLTLDSAEAFERTENVQLALLCAGIGKCRELEAAGIQPSLVAGLSIGAFGAAVAAHALSLTDAARLVLLRGRLMQGAYPSGYGMMAIGGLNLNTAEDITNAVDDIYVSNINSEQQIVLSGPLSSLDIAAKRAKDRGALYAKRIQVTVPSHCPLLMCPAKVLMEAFQKVEVKRPKVPYLSVNSGLMPHKPLKNEASMSLLKCRPAASSAHWQKQLLRTASSSRHRQRPQKKSLRELEDFNEVAAKATAYRTGCGRTCELLRQAQGNWLRAHASF